MTRYTPEYDVLRQIDVSRTTLRAWRRGTTCRSPAGDVYTYKALLTEGVHYVHIGRTVAYTDEGMRYIRRHIRKRATTAGT